MLSKEEFEELNKILLQLNAAIKNKRVYPNEHPKIREYNENLLKCLQEQINKHGPVTFRFLENQVVFQNTPKYEINDILVSLARSCRERNFQSITFLRDISINDLTMFIDAMNMPIEDLEKVGGIQKLLYSSEAFGILLEHIDIIPNTREAIVPAKDIYKLGINHIKNVMENTVFEEPKFDVEVVRSLIDNMISNLLYKKSTLLGLTAVKGYDEYTFCHSLNVSILAIALGIQLSIPRDILHILGMGGLLHDIGKITISKEVLNKPGKLSDEEWNMMRNHTVNGAKILQRTPGLEDHTAVIAYEHHVKYDFSGYPRIDQERPLSIYSLAVTIADCYDAMTTERSYKKAWKASDALAMMTELKGKDFDPELMDIFTEMIGVYPIGSFVRLDTNEYAIVYDVSIDESRPLVKIVINKKGEKLDTPEIADLRIKSPDTGKYSRSIVKSLDPLMMGINISDLLSV